MAGTQHQICRYLAEYHDEKRCTGRR
jgi:hypothetical protein